MREVIAVLAVALSAGAPPARPKATDRFQRAVRPMVKAINAGDYEAACRDFGPVMRKALPPEKAKAFFDNLKAELGSIKQIDSGRFVPPATAIFPARFERGAVLDIKIVLDSTDRVVGLWFLHHTPPVPVPEKHETKLSLPFRGRWYCFWGGDTKEQNQHHGVPNQRYAFDFLARDAQGKTHRGEGKKNEDYYCFSRPILAPADGVVTDVIRGVRDNVPGSMNPYSALGNAAFIRHRKHEVSVLAHFKLGSLRVKVGEKVKGAQVIGLCGNSGNSSEPHLHYHLQNVPIIQDATGIKVFFENVKVGKPDKTGGPVRAKRHSPVRGETVGPQDGSWASGNTRR